MSGAATARIPRTRWYETRRVRTSTTATGSSAAPITYARSPVGSPTTAGRRISQNAVPARVRCAAPALIDARRTIRTGREERTIASRTGPTRRPVASGRTWTTATVFVDATFG